MIKKFVALLFTMFMFTLPVYAADISVRGSNYNDIYTNEPVQILPADSKTPVLVISQWRRQDMEYTVEYDFKAEDAGGYRLTATTSEIDSAYTSNFYYSINGGEKVYSGDVFKTISKPGTSYGSDSMYLYDLGIVELKKGENTIKFFVNENRETSSNWALFYLDSFSFSKEEFAFDSVTPTKPSSVFEPTDDVGFTVQFTDFPETAKTYDIAVEDYFHNRILNKKVDLPANSVSFKLNFGKLCAGWYRLIISDGTDNIYNSGFSVVHDVGDRNTNTHFAIDFAGFALTSGKTEVKNLCRAIRLAGVDTVRERYYWAYGDWLYKYQNETIENEGLDVINMFHDTPSSLLDGGYMADDLFEVYNFQKNYAEKYSGAVDYMEVWNEEDTSFASETADEFAAFFKAAAIGIADGSETMGKSIGGFANSPKDTRYMDICMMNDLMEYSDLYNYHAYASNGKYFEKAPSLGYDEIRANRDILTAYGYDNRRVWVTEGGIAVKDGFERSRQQQARASVINNVQSVANGSDKHFLFVVPQYAEGSNEFGIFCKDKTPSPAYSSLETFTYYMGETDCKGIFRDLPDDTYGYLFNNGDKDIGIFWRGSGEGYVQIPSANAVAVDMMGNEKAVQAVNGLISVPVSMDPIYILFDEKIQENSYSAFKKEKPDYKRAEITDDKRIVIQQSFESRSYMDEKNKGYLIFRNDDNVCSLTVYNFSDKEQSGVIKARVSDSFVLDRTQQEITIPAMSSADIEFIIRTAENAEGNRKGFLEFSGTMNGKDITKSVSMIRCRKTDNIPLAGAFENAKTAANWQTYGSSSSGTVTVENVGTSGEELQFSVKLDGNGWSYPNFAVKDTSVLADSTGLKLSVGADEDVAQTILHCFLYMKDGRKYFEGNINGKTINAGYTDYYFPWDEMVLQHLPDGVEEKQFTTDDIAYIAIGVNLTSTSSATYKLKDIGWYVDDIGNDKVEWDDLRLSDIDSEASFFKGFAPAVTAQLPATDTITDVKVYLSGKEYGEYSLKDDVITVDLSKLDTGVYTLLVTAENEFGYIYRDSADFTIQ